MFNAFQQQIFRLCNLSRAGSSVLFCALWLEYCLCVLFSALCHFALTAFSNLYSQKNDVRLLEKVMRSLEKVMRLLGKVVRSSEKVMRLLGKVMRSLEKVIRSSEKSGEIVGKSSPIYRTTLFRGALERISTFQRTWNQRRTAHLSACSRLYLKNKQKASAPYDTSGSF